MVADTYQLFPSVITKLMDCKSDFTYDSSCLHFHLISRCTRVISLVNTVLFQRLFCFWFTMRIMYVDSLRAIDVFFVLFRRLLNEISCSLIIESLDCFPQFNKQIISISERRIFETHLIMKRVIDHCSNRFSIDEGFICTMDEPPRIHVANG